MVTNMRGVYNDHIATHVMAFLLAFARGLPHYAHDQRNRRYRRGTHRSVRPQEHPMSW